MIQTCYYNLIIYENIVETDYFISEKVYLEEYEISLKILKKYIKNIKKNHITDFQIEIFNTQIYYDENINDVLNVLKLEIEVVKDDIEKSKKITENIKKNVFDFSDFKNILETL